eukprot:2342858-Amphidinium_carterae.1
MPSRDMCYVAVLHFSCPREPTDNHRVTGYSLDCIGTTDAAVLGYAAVHQLSRLPVLLHHQYTGLGGQNLKKNSQQAVWHTPSVFPGRVALSHTIWMTKCRGRPTMNVRI